VKFPIGGTVREPFSNETGGPGEIPEPTVKVWMEEEHYFKIGSISVLK
jgi:hypothetical protein